MPFFAISAKEDEKLAPTIQSVYPETHRQVWPGLYLVFDEATTQQVGDRLGVADGSKGLVFISMVEYYWGYGPKDVWEWLKLKGPVQK
ncbi:MAG: hypothetical protein ACR2L2_14850 [Acidobacteriota bacterium]